MTKAEIFLFAHTCGRRRAVTLPSRNPQASVSLSTNPTEVANRRLLQTDNRRCNSSASFRRFSSATPVKSPRWNDFRASSVEWARGLVGGLRQAGNSDSGCLLLSCGKGWKRLTPANTVPRTADDVYQKRVGIHVSKRSRPILHTTTSRGQYLFLPNRVRSFKLFLAFQSRSRKGGTGHGKEFQGIG